VGNLYVLIGGYVSEPLELAVGWIGDSDGEPATVLNCADSMHTPNPGI
jgi:hypothetical protein